MGLPGVGTWGYITQTSSYWCFLVHSNVNSSCIHLTPTPMTLSSNYGLHPPNCEVNSSDLYISSITNFGRCGEIDKTGSSSYCDQWRSSGKVHVHRDTNKPWEVFPVLRQQMLNTIRGSFPQPVSPPYPCQSVPGLPMVVPLFDVAGFHLPQCSAVSCTLLHTAWIMFFIAEALAGARVQWRQLCQRWIIPWPMCPMCFYLKVSRNELAVPYDLRSPLSWWTSIKSFKARIQAWAITDLPTHRQPSLT